ncbi:MAG: cyanobacterial phytochrome A, partial [Deltaproteobacteria bacterium]
AIDLLEMASRAHMQNIIPVVDVALKQAGIAKELITAVAFTQAPGLIGSLLHYAHVGRSELNLREVALAHVVQDALEVLMPLFGERSVELVVSPTLPTVRGDPVLLGELFKNLMHNAVKYNDKAHRRLEVGQMATAESGCVVIFVRDNGMGIKAEHHDSIFKLFRRLHGRDRCGGGTGVGLTIAKKIVDRHGGQMWVESTVAEGTTFYCSLRQGPHEG